MIRDDDEKGPVVYWIITLSVDCGTKQTQGSRKGLLTFEARAIDHQLKLRCSFKREGLVGRIIFGQEQEYVYSGTPLLI